MTRILNIITGSNGGGRPVIDRNSKAPLQFRVKRLEIHRRPESLELRTRIRGFIGALLEAELVIALARKAL
jgi:hypothetical protein